MGAWSLGIWSMGIWEYRCLGMDAWSLGNICIWSMGIWGMGVWVWVLGKQLCTTCRHMSGYAVCTYLRLSSLLLCTGGRVASSLWVTMVTRSVVSMHVTTI